MLTPNRMAWVKAWEDDLTPSAAARRSAARVEARMNARRYYGREATARVPSPLPAKAVAKPAPALRVVTRRRSQWLVALAAALFVGLLLSACFIAPVLLRTATTSMESSLGKLEAQATELRATNSALVSRISSLSAPERIAEQASLLGLGPVQSVGYLELSPLMAAAEVDDKSTGR